MIKDFNISNNILGLKLISNINTQLGENLSLNPTQKSIGIITVEIDLPAYTALDEATKNANVEVIYAKSTYGGHTNSSTKLAGEFIGIIAGTTPEEVKSGLITASNYMDNFAGKIEFADQDNSIPYYAHCISKPGNYFSKIANLNQNDSISFLIAPPLEAMFGVDTALKFSSVEIGLLWKPPTATNFGGAILKGNESSCIAACEAFKEAIKNASKNPKF